MRALIASSKFNGWNDTGFAFGIIPPQKASGTDRPCRSVGSWAYGSAEAASKKKGSALAPSAEGPRGSD